jgi:vancomycin resistance protein YoaR
MNPRDPDLAAPQPEQDGPLEDWATEESIAEPGTTHDPSADQPATSSSPTSADPAATVSAGSATHEPAPEPARPPNAVSVPAAAPASWLASAEGLIPRDSVAPGPTGAPVGDRDPDHGFEGTRVYPRPQQAPVDSSLQPPAEPAESPTFGVRPVASDVNDPYGRQTLYGAATTAPAGTQAPAWDPRYDPARGYSQYDVRPRRGVPWRALLISFVLGLLLAGGVAGGAIYAYEQQYANRILPNVRVGSVELSGLTRDAARERLAAAYKGYGEGVVQVVLAGATTEIPYSDFDRRADFDAMLDAAFAVGRATSLADRLVGEFRAVTRGVALKPAVVLDAGKLEQRIDEIARTGEWEPVDATAVVTDIGFATTPARTGQSVDVGSAAADAVTRLATVDAPQSIQVSLVATAIPPAVPDASAQLATRQATLMANDVVLTDGPDSWVVPAASVHRWLSFTVINNRVRIAIDAKAALTELKPLAKKIDRQAVSATVKLQGTKIVFGKPSVDGRTFNPSKTTTAVVNALRNRALGNLAPNAPIAPVLALVKAALSTDQAKAAIPLMKEISSWTTPYQPSVRNGNGANIRIPTATINGHVVAPGETFSFWKAVGPVTPELGYTSGGAIIDGHTEPQGAIGGGICSCSTTLFNAALRAGFAMGDRLNHFYYINRYPLGLDATVFISASGQAQDMTWTNDTAYPVIIQGINGQGSVKFVLYSVPNGRTTTFTTPIVKNYTTAHTETRVDKTIPRGTTKQIEYATDGQDVWVTRSVKDKAGAVIHEETFYSHYATITGIILTNP